MQLEKLTINDDVTVFLPTPPLDDMPKSVRMEVSHHKAIISVVDVGLPLALYARNSWKNLIVLFSGSLCANVLSISSVVSIMDLAYLSSQLFQKKRCMED